MVEEVVEAEAEVVEEDGEAETEVEGEEEEEGTEGEGKWDRLCKTYTVKPPNKRPWAFAGIVGLERTFSPSSSFLRNGNRTIFSRDIAKNVKKHPNMDARV